MSWFALMDASQERSGHRAPEALAAVPAVPAVPARAAGRPAPVAGPTRSRMVANVVLSQAAWFAAVLGAAHGYPEAGSALVLAVIAWHLAVSARPGTEARLVLAVAAIGAVAETAVLQLGHVAYPDGQWLPWLPPHWLVALWAVFAITLNVTLRWLRGRGWLAALLGGLAGPLAFASGVRLGGARFVDPVAALAVIGAEWALLLPLLVWLAAHLDGVVPVPRARSARSRDGVLPHVMHPGERRDD